MMGASSLELLPLQKSMFGTCPVTRTNDSLVRVRDSASRLFRSIEGLNVICVH